MVVGVGSRELVRDEMITHQERFVALVVFRILQNQHKSSFSISLLAHVVVFGPDGLEVLGVERHGLGSREQQTRRISGVAQVI